MTHTYPLQWPIGWPRSRSYKYGGFKVTYEDAEKHLTRQLERLHVTNAYISTDQELRVDGRPRRDRQPNTVGVAVYFFRNGKELCIPCDKFANVRDNLRAIGLTIENIRQNERYGTDRTVDASLAGFKALPENAIVTPYTARTWHEVLQVTPTADAEVVKAAWRRLTAKFHPDNQETGNPTMLQEVRRAYEEWKDNHNR